MMALSQSLLKKAIVFSFNGSAQALRGCGIERRSCQMSEGRLTCVTAERAWTLKEEEAGERSKKVVMVVGSLKHMAWENSQ